VGRHLSLSFVLGHPPNGIRVRREHYSTRGLGTLLEAGALLMFEVDPDRSFLARSGVT
jgi:hypothetical protein